MCRKWRVLTKSSVEKQLFNFDKQDIADSVAGGVSDGGNSGGQFKNKGNVSGWFYSPVNCVSKWSKALNRAYQILWGWKDCIQ